MTPENWQAVWRIYENARELPADRQSAFVQSETADPGLAGQVFDLLASLAEEEASQPEGHSGRTGTQVGRYQVGELLGRGGVGEVYAALDTDLDRCVALKFLRPESIGDPAAVKRFIREAKAASALNHPNILTIHEVIDSGAGLAIAMEFVEGSALSAVRGIPQPVERVTRIGEQIGHALRAAHQADLIHRDIKPENILVRRDGYVKLVDFGLARRGSESCALPVLPQPGSADTAATGMTGTLRYMSPEQLRGEEISSASDIFSFGLVLYEIAAGQHPFPCDSHSATTEAILNRMPAHNPKVPPDLYRLILRMLAKDAAARPRADEVAEALADLTRPPARSHALWAKSVWAALGILLVCGIVVAWRWQPTPASVPLSGFRQVTTLAAENRAAAAAISPDGRWAAYANADGVFVQPTDNNVPKPLQAPGKFIVGRLMYSPDGTALLVSGFSIADSASEVWALSTAGGGSRLVRGHARGAAYSPDGKRIAFINEDRSEIWTMAADGTEARQILGGREELFLLVFWSPDGKRLNYQRRRLWAETDIDNPESDIVHASRYESADAETGQILAQVPSMPIITAAQLTDGRIVFIREGFPSGEKGANSGRGVWEVKTDPATGAFTEEPRLIDQMEKRTAVQSLTATPDGRRIMVVKRTDRSSVFVGDFNRAPPRLSNIRRIILDEGVNYPADWTQDARSLIFQSDRNGKPDLFKQDLDRGTPDTIVTTSQASPGAPDAWIGLAAMAPDGHTLLFALRPNPKKVVEFRLMRVPLEGGTPQFVPIGGMLDEYRCAVGGSRCVLRTAVAGQYFAFHELDAVRGKGRELARTAWSRSLLGDWGLSADGKHIAIPNHYSRDARIRIVSLEPEPNEPRERELQLPGLSDLKGVVWAADGSGWFVTSDTDIGGQMFFVFPDGRFHLLGDISGWLVPSRDPRRVAFVNRSTASNVWVLDRQ